MKKLLLIAAAFVSTSAFAQRHIDWSVTEIVSPATEVTSSVADGTPVTASFTCTNLSTDLVLPGDSVFYQVLLGMGNQVIAGHPNQANTVTFAAVVTDTIRQNETATFTAPAIKFNIYVNQSLNAFVAITSLLINRDPANPIAPEPAIDQLNNSKSKDITWWNPQHWNVGVAEVSKATTKVYPNPVSDKLHFETDYSKAKNITIIDITGKMISSINTSDFNTEVDVTKFNKGIYFYEIKTLEGVLIKSGKFNVQ